MSSLRLMYGLLFLCSLSTVVHSTSRVIYVDSSSPNATNDPSCWRGGVHSPCATLDWGLLAIHNYSSAINIIVRPGIYTFNSSEIGNFQRVSDINITGTINIDDPSSLYESVIVKCSIGSRAAAGFSFIYSSNISVSGIQFIGCQQERNSTSINSQNIFELINTTFYFLYCLNVQMYKISISDITGTAMVMYNTKGEVSIDNCTFENCQNGGLYIEYTYCDPMIDSGKCTNNSSTVNIEYTSKSQITVRNSKFINNSATLPKGLLNTHTFILPHKQSHSAFGRGGGISVFIKGNASNNHVKVENSIFEKNSALWGGGIFAEFQDSAHNNNFSATTCTLRNNKVAMINSTSSGLTGGGGVRVGFIYFENFYASGNEILFDNCTFESNEALFGGGLSFYTARQPTQHLLKNGFRVSNSRFNHNRARLGSAIDLSAWHPSLNGQVFMPVIENCSFYNNSPHDSSGRVGVGAVYVDTLHAVFSGNTTFVNNSGSALAVTGSYIIVEIDSSLLFENNKGRNGGGIALLGNTFVLINGNSQLTFINNTADYQGGAMYYYSSGERDLISSRSCMVRYADITVSPDQWDVVFTFRGNQANNKNNSIFASSVLSCLWGGASGNVNDTVTEVFCWDKTKWIYYDTNNAEVTDCTKQISSAPSNFENILPISYDMELIPGKVPIDLSSVLNISNDLNDYSVNSSAVYIATVLNISNNGSYRFESDESYNYVSHDQLYLYATENAVLNLKFETLDPIVVEKNIEVRFQGCPPGFVFTKESYTCQCAGYYNNYLTCHTREYYSTLSKGAWFGAADSETHSHWVVGLSPYVYNATSDTLPKSNDLLDHTLCKNVKRTGRLCGNCMVDHSIAFNSENYECIECSKYHHWNWIIYISTDFLPVTVFFVGVFVFSMTVTSGPLNSYIFFAQVINTVVKLNADGMIPVKYVFSKNGTIYNNVIQRLYTIPYDIWNLDYRAIFPHFCLIKDINTLTVLALQYVTAFYPLVLLFLFVVILMFYNRGIPIIVTMFRPLHNCFSRMRQYIGLNRATPNTTKTVIPAGIAVFIVISYTKFTLVSNLLLSFTPLYLHNGTMYKNVFYFNGSVDYPSSEGNWYVVPAVLVLCTFVAIPPLLLLYPSLLELLRRCSEKCQHGLFHDCLAKLHPNHKIQIFLNEFHGCYRDGSVDGGGIDCRWFAGLYFCLRIVLFTLYAQVDEWSMQYLVLILIFLVMAFLFSWLRPYRVDWINSLDTLMFINLAAISAINLFNLQSARLGESINKSVFVLQLVLVFLPLVYCIGYYFIILVLPVIMQCCRKVRHKQRHIQGQGVANDIMRANEGASDVEDSAHVEPFLDFVGNRRQFGFFSWRGNSRIRTSERLRRLDSEDRERQRNPIHNAATQQNTNGDSGNSSRNSESTPLYTAGSGSSSATPPAKYRSLDHST